MPIHRHPWDTDESYAARVAWNTDLQSRVILRVAQENNEYADERLTQLRNRSVEMRPVGIDAYAAALGF